MEAITDLLTATDVARILRLSRSSVYDLAARGALPHVAIADGRVRPIIRFERTAVQRWLADRERRSGAST